jgi:hypothetical protein
MWLVTAVVFVVVIVVDGIKICNRKLTTQTKHVFLMSVSC